MYNNVNKKTERFCGYAKRKCRQKIEGTKGAAQTHSKGSGGRARRCPARLSVQLRAARRAVQTVRYFRRLSPRTYGILKDIASRAARKVPRGSPVLGKRTQSKAGKEWEIR